MENVPIIVIKLLVKRRRFNQRC